MDRIRTFSIDSRRRYGRAVGKIPLDLGMVCPNRRFGGCLYCRPAAFTPASLRPGDSLDEQVRRGKALLLAGRYRQYFAYLQQETPTAQPTARLIDRLRPLLADPDCLGLIIATRPDAVAPDLPPALAELTLTGGRRCLIELGLQSIHEHSLRRLNRNHSLDDFLAASSRILAVGGLELGVHLILGIPGESEADMAASLERVCRLGISALKLHHLQVLADTPLYMDYRKGQVRVFSLAEYLELLTRLLPLIPAHITLHRLWATAHPDALVAPEWNCLSGELSRRLQALMAERGLFQGQAA